MRITEETRKSLTEDIYLCVSTVFTCRILEGDSLIAQILGVIVPNTFLVASHSGLISSSASQ